MCSMIKTTKSKAVGIIYEENEIHMPFVQLYCLDAYLKKKILRCHAHNHTCFKA